MYVCLPNDYYCSSQATPSVCDSMCSLEAEWVNGFDFLKATHWICCRTPILYLTPAYPKVRRTIKLALTLGIVQFLQLILHHYPKWKVDLSRGSKWVRLGLNFLLTFCMSLTSLWIIKRLAEHVGINLSDIAILRFVYIYMFLFLMSWTISCSSLANIYFSDLMM